MYTKHEGEGDSDFLLKAACAILRIDKEAYYALSLQACQTYNITAQAEVYAFHEGGRQSI